MIALAIRGWWERERMRPDLSRGARCMVSFMAPLLMSAYGHLPVINMVFTAVAAQSLANVDVRGPYALRLALLLAKTAIIAAAAALGALAGQPLGLALAATAIVAIGAGYWRHLSTEYGPSLAVASGLVFYIALAYHSGLKPAENHFIAAFAGGCWGTLLQIVFWPIRPQHPLRVAVSDAWLATGDLLAAIARPTAPAAPAGTPAPSPPAPLLESWMGAAASAMAAPQTAALSAVGTAEAALRQCLDRCYTALDGAAPAGKSPVVDRLRELNRWNARFGLRLSAYYSARGGAAPLPADWAEYEAPFLSVLQNLARSVAVAVVSHSPAHLATVNVRLRRATHLARVLRERAEALPGGKPLAEAIGEIERHLPDVAESVAATSDRAGERAAFSLELTDVPGTALRSLALALNLHGPWDRGLPRFMARIGVLTMCGVAAMKLTRLPHGYWLPFTMILVLQPDYGSTRQKAAQRLLGTLAGSAAASILLALHPPWPALMAAVACCCFVFGYYLKRNYALSVIFITVFVVALTDSFAPQTLRLAEERLGCTLAGGLLALAAAVLFWPVWERDRVRPILARGLRANAELFRLSFSAPAHIEDPAIVRARRRAETANAEVFASLQRMAGDPRNRQDRLETLAAVANGNRRLTRAAALALMQQPPPASPEFVAAANAALEALARGFADGHFPAGLAGLRRDVARAAPPPLGRAAAEISALVLEAGDFEFASVPVAGG
ncbi:MAG TPA: FUSC family protein [Opitutaceae bacterium]|nr:FUSC family protein [Opitutaceae bacterium]